jgi:pyridoxamine 5'-phosphate oxidase
VFPIDQAPDPIAPAEHPLRLLEAWLEDAERTGLPEPRACAFVTADSAGRPSARTVSLKRVEQDALVLSTALWTRKASELTENPHVALLFHWPAAGRQVHVSAQASVAERALAVELFDERDLAHRVQTLVSRQGEQIDGLENLRDLHAHVLATLEAPPSCPQDWGAVRLAPSAVEFWQQSPDRIHERALFLLREGAWERSLIAP